MVNRLAQILTLFFKMLFKELKRMMQICWRGRFSYPVEFFSILYFSKSLFTKSLRIIGLTCNLQLQI